MEKKAFSLQLKDNLKLEGEFDPLVMANGHACLGEGSLIFGRPEEARENLNIAIDLFMDYKGEENVQLDLANVLHFLGEAHSNRYKLIPHILHATSSGIVFNIEITNLTNIFSLT